MRHSVAAGKVWELWTNQLFLVKQGRRTFFTWRIYTTVMQFPRFTSILPGDHIHNVPVISLLFANIITIVLAIVGNWDVAAVMFVYWAQSVIIGLFTVVSILGADSSFLAADLRKPVDEQAGSKKITPIFASFYQFILAGFFTLHYGLFHWGYFIFIVDSGIFGNVNFADTSLWLSCGFFFANHLYSHITYRHEGQKGAGYVNEQFFTRTGGLSRCTSR